MENQRKIAKLIKKRVFIIPVRFVELTKNHNAALLLSQILYWSDKGRDEWFFKSYKSWEEEIFLTEYQVRNAGKILKKLELIDTKVKLVKGITTLHYKLDMERLISILGG